MRIERAYGELTRRSLERAADYAADADVRGVRSVVVAVYERDEKLGHARPDQVTALVQQLARTLADAERLQMARDRWHAEVESYRSYRDEMNRSLDRFGKVRSSLADIRLLAGPELTCLDDARNELDAARSGSRLPSRSNRCMTYSVVPCRLDVTRSRCDMPRCKMAISPPRGTPRQAPPAACSCLSAPSTNSTSCCVSRSCPSSGPAPH